MAHVHWLLVSYFALLGCSTTSTSTYRWARDASPSLVEQQPTLVEIRAGNRFCQGLLTDKRHVLTAASCVDDGQRILVRRITNRMDEITAKVVSLKFGGYAVLETSTDMLEIAPKKQVVKRDTSEPKELYFYSTKEHEWMAIKSGAAGLFDYAIAEQGAPLFSPKGVPTGVVLTRAFDVPAPLDFSEDVQNVSSDSGKGISPLDRLSMAVTFNPMLTAVSQRHHKTKLGANLDVGLSGTYDAFAANFGVNLGTFNGRYLSLSYTKDLFSNFEDTFYSIRPYIGTYYTSAHSPMCGLEFWAGKNVRVDLTYIDMKPDPAVMIRLNLPSLLY